MTTRAKKSTKATSKTSKDNSQIQTQLNFSTNEDSLTIPTPDATNSMPILRGNSQLNPAGTSAGASNEANATNAADKTNSAKENSQKGKIGLKDF